MIPLPSDPDNTRTPLITWGAGFRGPIILDTPEVPDEYSASFELEHLARRDVEQADVAAIMSTLLGSDWPVNSVGRLPDVDPSRPGFLDMSEEDIALSALTNMQVSMLFKAEMPAKPVSLQVLLVHYITKHSKPHLDCSSVIRTNAHVHVKTRNRNMRTVTSLSPCWITRARTVSIQVGDG